ncbi:hypothetical protein FHS18_000796 [Paenibacillus phyllosphaerae]|uniref:DUF2809 domain-containing protein n=1 Tax=Paenibacillus phyllosphaerae TaxID=274593 RepID=A0A7W5AU12_9BACL|nr:DUF2809 domain-containing protein [Paenibacillus phyllosphaerae]MBB3108768.1 hypothetical protein [Paenibacillus phyllosphaerae]
MTQRFGYACAVCVLIGLGLAVRAMGGQLPAFIASHAGDALWAAMVYAGFRMLLAHRPILASVIWSSVFSAAIECSQLYQADWMNAIRATTPGALVLGHGFLPVDLLRYAAGIGIAAGGDCLWHRRRM